MQGSGAGVGLWERLDELFADMPSLPMVKVMPSVVAGKTLHVMPLKFKCAVLYVEMRRKGCEESGGKRCMGQRAPSRSGADGKGRGAEHRFDRWLASHLCSGMYPGA